MSTRLVWKPKGGLQGVPGADVGLKTILRERFGFPKVFEKETPDCQYLEGLMDCGIKGAENLLHLVYEHSSIIVEEE